MKKLIHKDVIIEGNKLIAEFMGYKPSKTRGGIPYDEEKYGQSYNIEEYSFTPFDSIGGFMGDDCYYYPIDMGYHESWSWLMPVIAKMQQVFKLEKVKCLVEVEDLSFIALYQSLVNIDIKNTWKEVVIKIKWYNLKTKEE